jgi:hypothetical protein
MQLVDEPRASRIGLSYARGGDAVAPPAIGISFLKQQDSKNTWLDS